MVTDSNDQASLTQQLAQFAATTRYEDIPAKVVHESRRLLLDTLGCALAGIDTPSGVVARRFAAIGGGYPDATAIGLLDKTTPASAAYLNARLANILDADDTFPTSSHFGSATVFSAFALAEWSQSSARELLKSIAVGFEVGSRIGGWMGWPVRFENGEIVGWSPLAGPAATVTWASVGASTSILALDVEETKHAFGIAGANCPLPSMNKFAEQASVSMFKYTDAGWCSNVGVSAALLAQLGSTGYADILDGPNGFWRFYGSDSHDDDYLTDDLCGRWDILNTSYKPWPSCRYTHHPLTALEELLGNNDISVEDIDSITVRTMPFALTSIFVDQQPSDILTAQFSHAHAIAAFLQGLPPGPAWYSSEAMTSERSKDLRNRITVEAHPTAMRGMATSMQGPQWRQIPAEVEMKVGGKTLSQGADFAKGDPWSHGSRLSDEQLIEKFLTMVAPAGDEQLVDAAQGLAELVLTLDEKTDAPSLGREVASLSNRMLAATVS